MIKTYITKISGVYYAFAGDLKNNQVYSIGADNPPKESGGSVYFANWTDGGIVWVASPSPNKKAAIAKARRHGEYSGEI